MERKYKLTIIFLVIILIGIFSIDFYSKSSIKEIRVIGMNVSISPKQHIIGMNPTGELLHFGSIPRGGIGKRNITIEHNYSFPIKVEIKITGNITPFVAVSENDFLLQPREFKQVRVRVQPTNEAKTSAYVGNLTILFRKPLIFE